MPNYANGKIYSLRSFQTENIYIGSTTQPLKTRLSKHKNDFKRWQEGNLSLITSYEILKFDDCYIELICECPCENKEQLQKKEGETIREMDCVNKCIPGRTDREYYEDNREHLLEQKKQYAEEHKEEIAEYQKQYAEEHKEELAEYHANYYQEHKEEHSKNCKEWREKNKEHLKEYNKKRYETPERKAQLKTRSKIYYTCELCNKEVALCKKARHETTKEHLSNMSEYIPPPLKPDQEECECGSRYRKVGRGKHLTTKKHKKWLEEQEELETSSDEDSE
jgi:hypothetical protein